jgi:hypothetical protein
MSTVWDFGQELPVVDTQGTHVRAKARTGSFTIVAMVAGLFCSSPPLMPVHEGVTSVPIVSVRKAVRAEAETPAKRPPRRSREYYAADTRGGLSTHRLAQTFDGLFRPVNEESIPVDFSFG